MDLNATLERIQPVDPSWIERARARQLELTKPPGSLGRLEEIANRLAAIQETLAPSAAHARLVLFAADHGVCAEGVNPFPQSVTAQMVANFLRGGAAMNALAGVAGVELLIVDAGVANPIPGASALIRRPIAPGTANFCRGPAMSEAQAIASLELGIEMSGVDVGQAFPPANRLPGETAWPTGKLHLLAAGEMGIGNTTSASALAAVLTGLSPAAVVGRGTGADEACMARKLAAIERAVELHAPHIHTPLDLLARLGGFEIGAMCGLFLGAAAHRSAALVDGFIATSAAALAVRFQPAVRDYLIPAHRSTEPGQAPLLEMIGHRPLLDLEMRLGEGTGAALAVPVVRAAVAAFTGMATFASAGVAAAQEAS